MGIPRSDEVMLSEQTKAFYLEALALLQQSGLPFLIGGAYAFRHYTGIVRHTKDLDVFVHPAEAKRALDLFASAGYQTEFTYPHWLGKAFHREDFIDIIFNSGNTHATVDEQWFERAIEAEVLGVPVRLCPAEEMIWSKAFVMERERYDGADIAHLLYSLAGRLNWEHLLHRFESSWHVLLSHVILFRFIYPSERSRIPEAVVNGLVERLQEESRSLERAGRVCRGTLLSGAQYLVDVEQWGFEDARMEPWGKMTAGQREQWQTARLQGK